jgi:hypothetical protein
MIRQAIVVVWIAVAVGEDLMHGEARRTAAPPAAVPAGSMEIRRDAYRASFGREGFEYSPAIAGEHSPRLRWRYRLDGLEARGTRTPMAAVDPQVSADGPDVIEFRRPGLVERYVASDTGVEQVFVLERSPGPGDVRVAGEIRAFDVAARKDGGLSFSDRNGWSVHYSRPFAFDARNRPVDVRVELAGTRLSLILDGASLAGAVYPITIDPHLVAGPTLAFTYTDAQDTDVTFNAARNEFVVVFSASNPLQPGGRHIHVQRFDAVGNPIAPSQVVAATEVNVAPRVAHHLHSNRYLVVWQQTKLSTLKVFPVVRALLLDADAQPLGAAFTLNDAKGSRGYRPDVAARNFTAQKPAAADHSSWLVTWRTTTGELGSVAVMQERIHADGTEMGETQLSVNTTQVIGAVDEQAVAHDPVVDRYVVVWHENDALRGRTVGPVAGDLADEFEVEMPPPGGQHPRQPAIACDAGIPRCMVAYIVDSFLGDDLLAGTYMHSGAVPVQHYAKVIPEMLGQACARPAVTAEGGGFALAYQRFKPGAGLIPNAGWDVKGVALLTLSDYVHFPLTDDGSLHGLGADQTPSIALGAYGFTLNTWQRQTSSTQRSVATAVGFSTYQRFVHGKGGDYDGDGKSDLFLYEPAQHQWRIRTATAALFTVPMGMVGDLPVLMDVDADGRTDLGTWRPTSGQFRVLRSTTSTWQTANLGSGGDIPVPGDYVGGTADDFAVFRPWTGTWIVIDGEDATVHTRQLGEIGDIPVPADFDGDGKVDLAVWRSGDGWHSINMDGTGAIDYAGFAWADGTPLAADFTGDGVVDRSLVTFTIADWEIRDGKTDESRSRSLVSWTQGSIPMALDWWHDERLDLAVYNAKDQVWKICDPQIQAAFSVCGGVNLDTVPFGSARALPAAHP